MKRFIRVYGSGSGSVRHPADICPDNFGEEFVKLNEYVLNVINFHTPYETAGRKQKRLKKKTWIINQIRKKLKLPPNIL